MIHYFNPVHETAVLNASPYYMASANIVSMQKDLAFLAGWYVSVCDYILVEEPLLEDFKQLIAHFSPKLATAVTVNDIETGKIDISKQKVVLWGVSPQSVHFFKELNTKYVLDLIIPEWKTDYVRLCGRQTAMECLRIITEKCEEIPNNIIPEFYTNLIDIEHAVKKTSYQLLVKAPYSSSGRGLLWLPIKELTRTERQIIHGMLKKQGMVSLERALNKKLDFAMEFYADGRGKVSFEGLSLFQTNAKGAYIGNILDSQDAIEAKVSNLIDPTLITKVRGLLISFLSQEYAQLYEGYIGVDMLIYEENGVSHLQPCVEINMRTNMGIVALNLSQKYVHPQSRGYFSIDFSPLQGETYRRHIEMQELNPPRFENAKIRSGYLSLCPVNEYTKYRAYILIEER